MTMLSLAVRSLDRPETILEPVRRLGLINGRPLHVVAADNDDDSETIIIRSA
ncbi:MAG: hypothetical protein R2873_09915 [Caldilineaceae bacterium]